MIDADTFRSVMGRFATGVTIVTARGPRGECGMTVSSFASLSLSPPLILVCVDHDARMHAVLPTATHFGVNILTSHQEPLARRFSDPDEERFDGVAFEAGATGVPLILGVLATMECRKADVFPGGDHTIFTGVVEAARIGEGEPLLHYRGGYAELRR